MSYRFLRSSTTVTEDTSPTLCGYMSDRSMLSSLSRKPDPDDRDLHETERPSADAAYSLALDITKPSSSENFSPS